MQYIRNTNDMRYWSLNHEDKDTNKFITRAKRAITTGNHEPLRIQIKSLTMDDLNVLALMYMVSSQWNGATGQGGIWAQVSNLVNELARQELRTRPAFVIE